LNTKEIIGFPEPHGQAMPTARFDLVDQLQRVKGAEIARVVDIADRLSQRFGPEIGAGFLCYEILGRLPDGADCTSYVERLRRAPSAAAAIVEELLTLTGCEPPDAVGTA
jgi:hypothetical protein